MISARRLLVTVEQLDDKTYRRARQALLASGELVLLSGVGGRGNTNQWEIPDPRLLAGEPRTPTAGRRVPPPPGARPLIASVTAHVSTTSQESPAGCNVEAVSPAGKGGQGQTLFSATEAETPAERAAKPRQKPRRRTRARGRNPRTKEPNTTPPNPPQGRSDAGSITIEEAYTTSRGRTRHRRVNVSLDDVRRALRVPAASDHADWERIRKLLTKSVSSGIYAIWFDPVELIGIDPDGALVLDVPSELRGWLQDRFSRVIDDAAKTAGRATRIADVAQSTAMGAR